MTSPPPRILCRCSTCRLTLACACALAVVAAALTAGYALVARALP